MKKISTKLIIFAVLFFFIFFSLDYADQRAERVDKLFSAWDKPDSPGCALAIVHSGRIIYKRGYGMANLEHNIPITPQSVFYIGSVSKQFVALAVALLANQGKLSLDDDIRKYLPEIPDYGTPITIRHLIHHTSGLRDYLTLEDIAGVPFGNFHEQDVLELIARQKELNFAPGEEYLYSNSGYFLLGVIVERSSGRTLRKFAEESIFQPLGMKNSHFHDDYQSLIKNRASGYFPAGGGRFRNFISTFDCIGSGGLFTSVEDLFLWDQNFSHKRVGGEEVIDIMYTRGTLNSGKKLDYAFALNIGSYKGLRTVSHGGALEGYRAAFLRFPEQRFSVICLSNLSSFDPMKLSYQVADVYLADQFKEEEKSETKLQEEFTKLPESKLKEKVGDYIDLKTGALRRILLKRNQLILYAFGQQFPLGARSEMEFQLLKAPFRAAIRFEKQEKGKPMLMHVFPEAEKPETYESFKRVNPTAEQLKEYVGDYYSKELQVTFRLALKKGKLFFVHRNAPKPSLQPILKDWFSVRGFRIRFIRDEEKRITSFMLDTGRVKNLRFDSSSFSTVRSSAGLLPRSPLFLSGE